jgi:hypothetical protein
MHKLQPKALMIATDGSDSSKEALFVIKYNILFNILYLTASLKSYKFFIF